MQHRRDRPAALRTRILDSVPPASGAVVMGTGIVSIALLLDRRSTLSDILLVLDAVIWAMPRPPGSAPESPDKWTARARAKLIRSRGNWISSECESRHQEPYEQGHKAPAVFSHTACHHATVP